MSNLNKRIKELSKGHFTEKSTFCSYDFNDIYLQRTVDSQLVEERLYYDDKYLLALKTIFEFVFEDFESSPDYKDIWETIYAFPVENDMPLLRDNFLDNRKQIESINTTFSDSRLFLNAILKRAKSSKNNTFNGIANSKRSKFFVVGDIGVGKTTFFKYLYSKYFEKIKDSNCFYLHIDFSIDFYQKISISKSIKHEASRIFRLDYFDRLSGQEKSELKIFIANYYSNEISKFEEDYLKFEAKPYPQDFQPYSNLLQKGLINYIERRYGVIYIIDGLDKLNSLEEFQSKYEEVNTILSTSRRKGLFLFVMRYDSHESFHKSYLDNMNNAEKARPFGKVFKIEEAKLYNIINKRLNLLLMRWENIVDDNKDDIFVKIASEDEELLLQEVNNLKDKFHDFISVEAITSYFNIFLIYLQHGIALDEQIDYNVWEQKNSIRKLKNLVGNNFRNLMDAINLVHESFLSEISFLKLSVEDVIEIYLQLSELNNEFLKKDSTFADKFNKLLNKSYKVIPLLLRAKNSYLHPFYYQFSNITEELMRKGNYDPSKFLYNIFYPINSTDSYSQQYTILIKIRIIQLLETYENENKIINDKDQLCSTVKLYFHYKYQYVLLAVEELFLTRLIRFDIREYGYSIIASRTGKNHINNLVFNFGYYRIILTDTLIPIGFENSFIDPDPEMYDKNRPLWVLSQIPRIGLFLTLLKCVENKEYQSRPNKSIEFKSIAENILESLIKSITKICGAHDRDLVKLISAFEKLKKGLPNYTQTKN